MPLAADMDTQTFHRAETLWTKGSSCQKGAQVILSQALASSDQVKPGHTMEQYVHSGPLSVPLYILVGTAFELLLKCGITLASGEYRRDWLKIKIGHDLTRALKAAREAGFEPQIDGLANAVSYLSKPYSRHFFRYESPSSFNVPDMKQSVEILAKLEHALVEQFPQLMQR